MERNRHRDQQVRIEEQSVNCSPLMVEEKRSRQGEDERTDQEGTATVDGMSEEVGQATCCRCVFLWTLTQFNWKAAVGSRFPSKCKSSKMYKSFFYLTVYLFPVLED